jgi:hypothetical protein
MSFVVKKLPLAEQDALDAAIWYEERQPGLGDEFLTEVDRAVRTLCETPLLHRVRFADVRRASVHRFRFYGVYYIVNEQEVLGSGDLSRTAASTPVGRAARTDRIKFVLAKYRDEVAAVTAPPRVNRADSASTASVFRRSSNRLHANFWLVLDPSLDQDKNAFFHVAFIN